MIKDYREEFQSPMGIVSSAKSGCICTRTGAIPVSIPDGDSFLREEIEPPQSAIRIQMFQSPMGIVSSAKTGYQFFRNVVTSVSIPDGDSFLREELARTSIPKNRKSFNPRWG